MRVKSTVVRVLSFANPLEQDLTHILKEMQPRLQLTEDQYKYWSAKLQIRLVEFEAAQKIPVIHVEAHPAAGWIAFETFSSEVKR